MTIYSMVGGARARVHARQARPQSRRRPANVRPLRRTRGAAMSACINAPRCKGMAARAWSDFHGRVIGYLSCAACIRREAEANGVRLWGQPTRGEQLELFAT